MPEKRAKTSTRQVVQDALTHQRLSVLSWAFAAILFGSMGFASLQFGRGAYSDRLSVRNGQVLPPPGDVATTASIAPETGGGRVGLMPSINGRIATGIDEVKNSQIETLQLEVVALRRRLGALAEQNMTYSRRIAALEEQITQGQAIERTETAPDKPAPHEPVPVPGKVKAAPPAPAIRTSSPSPSPPVQNGETSTEASDRAVQKRIETVPAPETVAGYDAQIRKNLQLRGQTPIATQQSAGTPDRTFQPVRIADILKGEPEPIVTGSIAPTEAQDFTPPLIVPSKPAGRSNGAGNSLISHSDFGAVVGRYPSPEKAAEAWKTFREQNEERMRDLRPVINKSDMDENYALLVGPFGNAANAAVACLRLLEVTGTCHPALYVGAPLPELEISKAN